jgi:hypothetical protein
MTSLNHLSEKFSPSQLAMPVPELDINARAANALRGAGIKTLGELLAYPNLLSLSNLGRDSFHNIRGAVHGLLAKNCTQAEQQPTDVDAAPVEMTRTDMLRMLRLLWTIDAWASGMGKPIPEFLHADFRHIENKLAQLFAKEHAQ